MHAGGTEVRAVMSAGAAGGVGQRKEAEARARGGQHQILRPSTAACDFEKKTLRWRSKQAVESRCSGLGRGRTHL